MLIIFLQQHAPLCFIAYLCVWYLVGLYQLNTTISGYKLSLKASKPPGGAMIIKIYVQKKKDTWLWLGRNVYVLDRHGGGGGFMVLEIRLETEIYITKLGH